uniref:Soluble interferon alpha/beta receptor OPG204 n=1 Tax=Eptatretus burgeri TaxID=7764 RepID=A0A8C4NA91_EPTBU
MPSLDSVDLMVALHHLRSSSIQNHDLRYTRVNPSSILKLSFLQVSSFSLLRVSFDIHLVHTRRDRCHMGAGHLFPLLLGLKLVTCIPPTIEPSECNIAVFSLPGEAAVINCDLPLQTDVDDSSLQNDSKSDGGADEIQWWLKPSNQESPTHRVYPGDDTYMMYDSALWLLHTRPEHAGVYICVRGKQSVCHVLKVWRPDTSSCYHSESSYSFTANIGSSKTIRCPALNHLQSNVTINWFKDCKKVVHEVHLTNAPNSYSIMKIKDWKAGNYTCTANVSLQGRFYYFSRSINLTVRARPIRKRPKIIHPNGNVYLGVDLGSPVQLYCQAFFGYDEGMDPLMYWLVDGQFVDFPEMQEDDLPIMIEDDNGDKMMQSDINITKVDESHIGLNFTCITQNGFGFGSGSIFLYVKEKNRAATLGVAMAVALVVIIGISAIAFYLRFDIVLFYRDHLAPEPPSDGKDFDAYVCVAWDAPPDELQFALRILPAALEQKFGFRLWLFGRDAIPGKNVIDEVVSAVGRSRRMLIVLSPACVKESSSSRLDLDVGLHAMHNGSLRTLLLSFQPLPSSTMSSLDSRPALKRALKVLPKVYWKGEKSQPLNSRFWKHLRYLMPTQNLHSLSSSQDPSSTVTTNGTAITSQNNGSLSLDTLSPLLTTESIVL